MQTWQTILDAVQHALAGRSATARVDLQGLWDYADPKDAAPRCVIAHYLADQQHDLGDDIAWDERALSPELFGIALAAMMAIGLLVTILTWFVVLPLTRHGSLLQSPLGQRLLAWGVMIPLATTFLGWLYREEARQPWFVIGQVTTADAMNSLPGLQLVLMCVVFIGISAFAALIGWRRVYEAMHARAAPVTPPAARDLELLGWT